MLILLDLHDIYMAYNIYYVSYSRVIGCMGAIDQASVWDRQMHKYEIYRQFEMNFFIIKLCNVNI